MLLPRVLMTAQLAARQLGSDQRRTASGLLAETYQCVTGAMANIGQNDLAWVAADRGILAAEQSDDPLVVAASTRMLAHALLAMGRSEKAQQVALTALTPGPRQSAGVSGSWGCDAQEWQDPGGVAGVVA